MHKIVNVEVVALKLEYFESLILLNKNKNTFCEYE
jgi:hypothetical protein